MWFFVLFCNRDKKREYKKSIKMTSANALGDWPMKQNDSIISWYRRKPNYKCYYRYQLWGYGSFGSPVHDDAIYSIIVWDI